MPTPYPHATAPETPVDEAHHDHCRSAPANAPAWPQRRWDRRGNGEHGGPQACRYGSAREPSISLGVVVPEAVEAEADEILRHRLVLARRGPAPPTTMTVHRVEPISIGTEERRAECTTTDHIRGAAPTTSPA
jgi:hypothetical protein